MENINKETENKKEQKDIEMPKKEKNSIEKDVSFFDKQVKWKVIFGSGDETEDSYLWE